eukprot:COSAG06_NODE_15720_length_1050_cov_1.109359_1_plen_46_part_10
MLSAAASAADLHDAIHDARSSSLVAYGVEGVEPSPPPLGNAQLRPA